MFLDQVGSAADQKEFGLIRALVPLPERFRALLEARGTLKGAIGNGTLLHFQASVEPTKGDVHEQVEAQNDFPSLAAPK